MAKKKDSSIQKVSPNLPQRPDFMQDAEAVGLELLKQYVTPPRIKVVQKQSSDDLLDLFGIGDVIVVPNQSLISKMGSDDRGRPTGEAEPFRFVPLYFYPEWCQWTPLDMRGQMPSVLERTLDPQSALAAKAANPKLRKEKHPEMPNVDLNNVEHLNYVITLLDHELAGEVMVLSFSRGEHFAGRRFASLLQVRRAPIFGCVFEGVCSYRPGTGKGDWWGIDVRNPQDGNSWVTDKQAYDRFAELHAEFRSVHQKGLLRANYDDDTPGGDDIEVPAIKEEF